MLWAFLLLPILFFSANIKAQGTPNINSTKEIKTMSKINETKTAKTPTSGVPLKRLGSLETELIDKLFLELSQFTKAKTNAEINLQHKYNELIMN